MTYSEIQVVKKKVKFGRKKGNFIKKFNIICRKTKKAGAAAAHAPDLIPNAVVPKIMFSEYPINFVLYGFTF